MPSDLQFATELSDALCVVLRETREALGLSLGELARRTGLNRQAITFIERGSRRPTSETLSRHTLALGMLPSEAWAKAETMISARRWKKVLMDSTTPTP